MINENNFIDEVWNKYASYLKQSVKDKFFKKYQYKNIDAMRNINTIFSLFLITISSIGIVYASTYLYKELYQVFSQRNNIKEFNFNEFYNDMIFKNGIYYKNILTYQEYIIDKEKFGDIAKMTEEDFNNNFVVVISLEKFENANAKVWDYYSDDTTLYIKLKNNKEYSNIKNNVLSVKLDKSEMRENLEIDFLNEKTNSKDYTSLEELSKDYSKEQAIEDGCFVIMNNEIISPNRGEIVEFEEKVKNNEDTFIRVVTVLFNEKNFVKESLIIRDIQYKNGEFLVAYDQTRTNNFITGLTQKDYIYTKSKGSLKSKYYNNYTLKTYYIEKIEEENIFLKNSSYNIISICAYNEN